MTSCPCGVPGFTVRKDLAKHILTSHGVGAGFRATFLADRIMEGRPLAPEDLAVFGPNAVQARPRRAPEPPAPAFPDDATLNQRLAAAGMAVASGRPARRQTPAAPAERKTAAVDDEDLEDVDKLIEESERLAAEEDLVGEDDGEDLAELEEQKRDEVGEPEARQAPRTPARRGGRRARRRVQAPRDHPDVQDVLSKATVNGAEAPQGPREPAPKVETPARPGIAEEGASAPPVSPDSKPARSQENAMARSCGRCKKLGHEMKDCPELKDIGLCGGCKRPKDEQHASWCPRKNGAAKKAAAKSVKAARPVKKPRGSRRASNGAVAPVAAAFVVNGAKAQAKTLLESLRRIRDRLDERIKGVEELVDIL